MEYQKLLPLLSTFRPIGQVLTGLIAWLIIPMKGLYCTEEMNCHSERNRGWRVMQLTLGFLTVGILSLSFIVFRMFESPRYLFSRKKYQEAGQVLQNLTKINNSSTTLIAESAFKFETYAVTNQIIPPTTKKTNAHNPMKDIFSKELRVTSTLIILLYVILSLGNFVMDL